MFSIHNNIYDNNTTKFQLLFELLEIGLQLINIKNAKSCWRIYNFINTKVEISYVVRDVFMCFERKGLSLDENKEEKDRLIDR